MVVDKSVLEQALEALEYEHRSPRGYGYELSVYEMRETSAAITTLRAVLAQEDEMREMLRTLGFGSQCPESIGITLRRWRDGYAAALAQQEEPVVDEEIGRRE